jgi:hypothetical protein
MNIAETMSRIAAELALFAGAGFLLFAINDVLVDLIYFTRRLWRGVTVYSRYPRVVALWITAERRQAIGQYGGGRNAFAFFAETGFYDRPMPWGFRLDGAMPRAASSGSAAATCSPTAALPSRGRSIVNSPAASGCGVASSPACTASTPVRGCR